MVVLSCLVVIFSRLFCCAMGLCCVEFSCLVSCCVVLSRFLLLLTSVVVLYCIGLSCRVLSCVVMCCVVLPCVAFCCIIAAVVSCVVFDFCDGLVLLPDMVLCCLVMCRLVLYFRAFSLVFRYRYCLSSTNLPSLPCRMKDFFLKDCTFRDDEMYIRPMACLLCGEGPFSSLYDLHVHFIECFEDHRPVEVVEVVIDNRQMGEVIVVVVFLSFILGFDLVFVVPIFVLDASF